MIDLRVDLKEITKASSRYSRLMRSMSNRQLDRLAYLTAKETMTELRDATPVRFTGLTKRAWYIVKAGVGHYRVVNKTKAIRFLEYGTVAHGPVRARAMFIPLNEVAHRGWTRGLVYGLDYRLSKWVRGIKALRLVENEKRKTFLRFRIAYHDYMEQNAAKVNIRKK